MQNDPKWTYIEDLGKHNDELVTIKGWVHNRRSSGKVRFLLVRDGTGVVQCVATRRDLASEAFASIDHIAQETSIIVEGTVKADKRAPGGYELQLSDLTVVHESVDYPITPKEHGVDFLLSKRHLWLRSQRQQALMRVRAVIMRSIRDFLDEQGFLEIDAPILTPNSVEGTTSLFEIDYFGDTAYLSQSGQLYVEAAALAFGRVYCFGPVFRAEKSKTRRHLMEFWMVEPEMAYFEHEDSLGLQERFVSAVVGEVLSECEDELASLERDTTLLEKTTPPFPRITYDEAVAILARNGIDKEWGDDFGAPDETLLASQFDRPVFVERFPSSCKPFYTQPAPDRPEVALCDDLLAPEGYGEIIGGSERVHDFELLRRRLRESELPEDDYQWYLDLRRYGSVPHSGFGLGIERTVAWICGLQHVRETIPFPRMLDRIYP